MIPQTIEQFLKKKHLPYTAHHHQKTITAEELAQRECIDGHQVAKVIVMRDQGKYYMLVLPASYFVDLKMVRQATGHEHMHFATEEEIQELFPDCEIGAMPPLGSMYKMPVYVEQALVDNEEIEFNAGTHEDAIRMKYGDWAATVKAKALHFAKKWREYL